jgi:hypothetical protein
MFDIIDARCNREGKQYVSNTGHLSILDTPFEII